VHTRLRAYETGTLSGMNDQLLPLDIGPLNPSGYGIIVGLVSFGLVLAVLSKRLLPRITRVLEEREEKTRGVSAQAEALLVEAMAVRADYDAELAAARHDAARTRQHAHEEGARLITEARAEGLRERERILAAGAAEIEAERIAAEAELRADVDAWARALAERILGEPVGAPADRFPGSA
jgi:F-type H+-transporting ATPase subunit b